MSTITYTLPKNAAELKKLNDGAIAQAATLRVVVQQAAVANLHHAMKHGDYTGVNYLVNGLGHGVKRDSLVMYFVTVGGLIIDPNDASLGFTSWKGKKHIEENFKLAKSKHWYEYKKPKDPFTGFSFEEEVKAFIAKNRKVKARVGKIEDEDVKGMYNFSLSDETMGALLELANFEAVTSEGAVNDDLTGEVVNALKVAVA